ncbi:type IX secretion system sortase PorU [Rufibacter sediminis]|uniref:Type IX secretion system sortase PorU n=1 Tax=Rufibacter sediminis TaxID=2762756 RepID=A0ABR6VXS1_9BACT|nr:type IX secretion system sortase PorU [Rufibacter sediminis]MBC3541717.1 type IX secretion system sortase PorU [Rufibacter sediminis]
MHLVRKFLFAAGVWLAAFSAWAQTPETRTITWRAAAAGLSPGTPATAALPVFEEAAFQGREVLPFYLLSVPNVQVSSFEFTSLEFGPLTEAEMRSFPKKGLKTELQTSISSGTANRLPHSVVAFQPFRLNPQTGAVEKLLKFSYRYTSGNNLRKAPGQASVRRTYSTRSVLASGEWYKIGVPASGMYKLDRAALQAMGLNLQNLNPRNLRLFGNGGGMLPQANSAPRPDDLVENAVWVEGEQDGSFDANDYLLFYGQGPHTWAENPVTGQSPFLHSLHLYSDTTYYYLTVGPSAGLRLSQQASLPGSFPVVQTYDERWFHEVDLRNMVNSGREWFGEEFTSFALQQNFTVPASDLVPNSNVWFTSAVMANSPENSSFSVRLNGSALGTHQISGRGSYNYHPEGVSQVLQFSPALGSLAYSNELNVAYTYQPGNSSSATGYLNYFTLVAERQLKLYGNQTSFRNLASKRNAVTTFQISGLTASDAQVWDVTDPLKPVKQTITLSNGTASFSANSQQLREYLAFQGSAFPTPTFLGKVANQNLHSLNLNGELDMIIITPTAFSAQAQRLAAHRRSRSGLEVEVVELPKIYEEFSSGKQDITAIRDFLKMLYERSHKQGDDLLQVALLGDASFDPKNRIQQNTNFIPIYESRQSLDPILSYSSDDYIGFLDEDEGEWSEVDFSRAHLLDVGIGRLPVKSSAEADLVIDKIIRYESEQTLGNWRKRLIFLADDGDSNEHLNDADYLAEFVERNHSDYLPQKIYLDLYPQISVPNGQRSPETNQALREAIEKGALVTNYTGHGNEVSLADEQILTINEIQSWKNRNKLTFFLTATCEIGRYDDPRRTSGAETALFHPEGGAIGLLTTTRPVYSDGNRALNTNFFNFLFSPLSDGSMPTVGVLTQKTKNASLFGVNNRNFALLGDPAMRLAYPSLEVVLSKLNGKPFTSASADTLQALSKVQLEGVVQNSQQQVATDFQGQIHLTVYDKRATLTTLGDQNARRQVLNRSNVLYDGLATIKNGAFQVTFVIPKDINYQIGAGSIHLYASSSSLDGHGATGVPVGGANADAAADNTPPQLELYMNDASFVSGGITGTDATLLAHLFDDNGINTAGAGIGHEITAILDEKSSEPIILNEFYTADVDSYQSGKVRYSLKNVPIGPHTLSLKAWDTHNNSNTTKIEFIVASSEKLALDHVFNIPNPFLTNTTFHFDHNRPGQELDILIQVFTVSGKLVKSLHGFGDGSTHFSDLTWDGRDDSNDVLAKGVYIYKVNVRSRQDGASTSRYEKLVLLK